MRAASEQGVFIPQIGHNQPRLNWITSMITFPDVDNEQPWARQRKAASPAASSQAPHYKHTFPRSEHQPRVALIASASRLQNIREK